MAHSYIHRKIRLDIALAVNNCDSNGIHPDPAQELGSVLYAGPRDAAILPGG
ncbi:hypothetical protein BV22DRAFT_1039208 [Leucogyrophana mollusca]|uniref:Uncharacterized protein n=1 Tax=Leucogyrophana mollusca TaxID=85980 RepID=A0ACB8B6E4_9AGAM|nr:hypothetical protein BV22DRAFT_1039208 [Leucogyrophana mollusca]